MTDSRLRRPLAVFAASCLLALGVTACGSKDDDSGNEGSVAVKATGKSGHQGGEITPGKKAPASAGDKSPNAPDGGISDRPGGPSKPVQP